MERNTLVEDYPSIPIQECQDIVNCLMLRETGVEDIDYIQSKGGIKWLTEGLKTDVLNGVDEKTIAQREEKYGSNKKEVPEPKTWWFFAKEALEDFMLRVLIVAGVASIIIDEIMDSEEREIAWIEGFAILFAVFLIVVVTATNNLKKEKEFIQLNKEAESGKVVTIIRNGQLMRDKSIEDVLVGDLVCVKAGMENPADAIIVEGFSIQMDESSVTGESKAMNKNTFEECLAKKEMFQKTNPGKQLKAHELPSPVLLAGTKVVGGTGKMLIINVGKYSAIGKINELVESAEDELTPLQLKLEKIARDIGFFGLISAVVLFTVLIVRWIIQNSVNYQGKGWGNTPAIEQVNYVLQSLLMGVTVLVVAIPEGLPLAVTLSLAFSVSKMMEEKNLVRKLAACETMGGANIICSDKTGTLTKNEMYLTNFWCGDEHSVYDSSSGKEVHFDSFVHKDCHELFVNVIVCNSLEDPNQKKGNPTEMSLLKYIMMCKIDVLGWRDKYPRIFQATFTSDRKRMSTIVRLNNGKTYVFLKGASEQVVDVCDYFHNIQTNEVSPISYQQKKDLIEVIESMARKALRTIGIAYKEINMEQTNIDNPDEKGLHDFEKSGFYMLGVCGIRDVIRPEVPPSIKKCHRAGVDVKMVTGDNKITAFAIAKEIGIIDEENEKTAIVMEGPEFLKQIGKVTCANCREKINSGGVCDCVKNEKELEKPENKGKQVRKDTIQNGEAFDRIWKDLKVLARSRPEDKYALVTGLKERGNVVAVTGDGTNDAPALSKANVGFAMNIAGTEVAKHAADILLMDDNFASIVVAVKWGRNIYASIQKFLQLQLTVNVVAVLITFISAVSLQEAVLSTVQMLWVNLIMDTLAALALATEPPTDELLLRKPVNKDSYIITPIMIKHILGQSAYQLAVMLVFIFAGDKFLFDLNGRQINHQFSNPESILIVNGFAAFGYDRNDYGGSYSVHAAYNFNVFIMMTFFNFFCCRILDDSFNVFKNIMKSTILIIIMTSIFGFQIIFLTFCGPAVRIIFWVI